MHQCYGSKKNELKNEVPSREYVPLYKVAKVSGSGVDQKIAQNFFKDGALFETDSSSNSWILIEFPRNIELPQGFSFTHGHNDNSYRLKNWIVLISQDKITWHIIGKYNNNEHKPIRNFMFQQSATPISSFCYMKITSNGSYQENGTSMLAISGFRLFW